MTIEITHDNRVRVWRINDEHCAVWIESGGVAATVSLNNEERMRMIAALREPVEPIVLGGPGVKQ